MQYTPIGVDTKINDRKSSWTDSQTVKKAGKNMNTVTLQLEWTYQIIKMIEKILGQIHKQQKAGVSTDTYSKGKKILDSDNEEVKEKVLSDEMGNGNRKSRWQNGTLNYLNL